MVYLMTAVTLINKINNSCDTNKTKQKKTKNKKQKPKK